MDHAYQLPLSWNGLPIGCWTVNGGREGKCVDIGDDFVRWQAVPERIYETHREAQQRSRARFLGFCAYFLADTCALFLRTPAVNQKNLLDTEGWIGNWVGWRLMCGIWGIAEWKEGILGAPGARREIKTYAGHRKIRKNWGSWKNSRG